MQTEQQTIRNLMKICDEKDEKMRELEVGVAELEDKHGEIERLQGEGRKHH